MSSSDHISNIVSSTNSNSNNGNNGNSDRTALISVSRKEGVLEFAGALSKRGWNIISTGGTAGMLKEGGVEVRKVSAVTGFPEILDGRVKTLHPRIHGGILARRDLSAHLDELHKAGIGPIDMVVVNLYPFVETISRENVTMTEALENIDIGGPAMVRAAAKNFPGVIVVVNPARYPDVLAELDEQGDVSPETRCSLAYEAFAHTAEYDSYISAYLSRRPEAGAGDFPARVIYPYEKVQELRYGENPHQKAAFYREAGAVPGTVAMAEQLQGKELSFNNINDLNAAWELVKEFSETAVVAVKHANPCGVGIGAGVLESYIKAYQADPVSIFGGIVAINCPVDRETAAKMGEIFLEVVAAPDYSEEALAVFKNKPEVRLLKIPLNKKISGNAPEMKKVSGGILVQDTDTGVASLSDGKVVTERAPSAGELKDLEFTMRVVKHVKSNAIVVGRSGQTLGIGAGQMNRVGSARIAITRAGDQVKGAVLASDAFFPFPDTAEEAARAGITAIVQPGGSLKDGEAIAICNKHNMAMVFTGRRHFKH